MEQEQGLKNLICLVDIFGFNLSFRHDTNTKYKTRSGGIATIISVILCFLFFFYSSLDIFYQTNPTITKTNHYLEQVNITSEDFFFAFFFSDKFIHPFNENEIEDIKDYFDFFAIANYHLGNDTILSDRLEFKKCLSLNHNSIDYFLNSTSVFKIDGHHNAEKKNHSYCLDLDTEKRGDFRLMNSLYEVPKISLSIKVKPCNKTLKSSCKDFKIFNESLMLNSFYINSYIDIDREEINKKIIKSESVPIYFEKQSTYRLYVTYQNSKTIIDNGTFFKNNSPLSYPKISNYVIDEVPKYDNLFYNLEMDSDHFQSATTIRYMKIQDALAATGGFISILRTILMLIFNIINKYKFSFMIFSDVYLDKKNFITFYKDKNCEYFLAENKENILDLKNERNVFREEHDLIINRARRYTKKINRDKEKSSKIIPEIKNYNENNNYNKDYPEIEEMVIDEENFPDPVISVSPAFFHKKNNNEIRDILPEFNLSPIKHQKKDQNIEDKSIFSIPQSSSRILKNLEMNELKKNNIGNIKQENVKKFMEYNTNKDKEKNGNVSNIENQENLNNKFKTINPNKIREFSAKKIEKSSLIDLYCKDDKTINSKKQLNDKNNIFDQKINKFSLNKENIIDEGSLKNQKEVRLENKKTKKKDFQIKVNEEKVQFKLNLWNYVCARLCRQEKKLKSLDIILKKVFREMEIRNYLLLKEDVNLLKEIFFGKENEEYFTHKYDFTDIYKSQINIDGRNSVLSRNFGTQKPNKTPLNKNASKTIIDARNQAKNMVNTLKD